LKLEEISTRLRPGRPRIVQTGERGRPRKQYNGIRTDDIETPKSVAEALSSQYVRN